MDHSCGQTQRTRRAADTVSPDIWGAPAPRCAFVDPKATLFPGFSAQAIEAGFRENATEFLEDDAAGSLSQAARPARAETSFGDTPARFAAGDGQGEAYADRYHGESEQAALSGMFPADFARGVRHRESPADSLATARPLPRSGGSVVGHGDAGATAYPRPAAPHWGSYMPGLSANPGVLQTSELRGTEALAHQDSLTVFPAAAAAAMNQNPLPALRHFAQDAPPGYGPPAPQGAPPHHAVLPGSIAPAHQAAAPSPSTPGQDASPNAEAAGRKRDGGLFFEPDEHFCRVFHVDQNEAPRGEVRPLIDAQASRNIFNEPEGRDSRGAMCYRRNYVEVQASYCLPECPNGGVLHCATPGQPQSFAIQAFWINLTAAIDHSGGKTVGLVQHTAKRDKGPVFPPRRVLLPPTAVDDSGSLRSHGLANPANGPCLPRQAQDLNCSLFSSSKHTYDRIQFVQATANNGRRRAQQQTFKLIVELLAECRYPGASESHLIKISQRASEALIVRGRSPGHYTGTSKRAPKKARAPARKKTPGPRRGPIPVTSANMGNSLRGGLPNQTVPPPSHSHLPVLHTPATSPSNQLSSPLSRRRSDEEMAFPQPATNAAMSPHAHTPSGPGTGTYYGAQHNWTTSRFSPEASMVGQQFDPAALPDAADDQWFAADFQLSGASFPGMRSNNYGF